MRQDLLWAGIGMFLLEIIAVMIMIVPWTTELFVIIIGGTVIAVFNVAALLFVVFGLASREK